MKTEENELVRIENIIEYCKKIRSDSESLLNLYRSDKAIIESVYNAECMLLKLLKRESVRLSKKLIVLISNYNGILYKYNYDGVFNDIIDSRCQQVCELYSSIAAEKDTINLMDKFVDPLIYESNSYVPKVITELSSIIDKEYILLEGLVRIVASEITRLKYNPDLYFNRRNNKIKE